MKILLRVNNDFARVTMVSLKCRVVLATNRIAVIL